MKVGCGVMGGAQPRGATRVGGARRVVEGQSVWSKKRAEEVCLGMVGWRGGEGWGWWWQTVCNRGVTGVGGRGKRVMMVLVVSNDVLSRCDRGEKRGAVGDGGRGGLKRRARAV